MYDPKLDTFVIVAEHASISAAARTLNVTQSAVTQQIAALESRLGVQLFTRNARGVALTVAGEEFLAGAREIIACCNGVKERMRSYIQEDDRSLVIESDFLPHDYLYEIISRYTQRFPERRVTFIPSDNQRPFHEVANGEADLCISYQGGAIRSSGLVFEYLFDETERIVFSETSPLAQLDTVGFDDLKGYTLFLPTRGFGDSSDESRRAALAAGASVAGESTNMDLSTWEQTLETVPRTAALILEQHVMSVGHLVCRPFRSVTTPHAGIAYRENPKRAVRDFVEVAKEWRDEQNGAEPPAAR